MIHRDLLTVQPDQSSRLAQPHPDEPGTLTEQMAAVDHFLGMPWAKTDPREAWQLARRLCIPHARRASR